MKAEALFQVPDTKALDVCIAELAVSFQRQIDAGTIKVYRRALMDLPFWAIQEAAQELSRKGGEFFPPAPVWHRAAEERIHAKTRDLLAARPAADAAPECDGCRDTGWVEEVREDRTVCIPCSCRATNSNYQRMTKSSRKSLNEEVKKK